MTSASSSYLCDTLPAAKLADPDSLMRTPSPPATSTTFDVPSLAPADTPVDWDSNRHPSPHVSDQLAPTSPPARKLCVRHQRMADEGTNLKLQEALDALSVEEREAINAIWSNFSSSPHRRRELILRGILTMCCFSQLSLLTEQLNHLIRIDPFAVLPREVAFKILTHLDATSLCRAAQVSHSWRRLADDDILWRGICEQHIGTKCSNCGWGLPVLERRRNVAPTSPSPSPAPATLPPVPDPEHPSAASSPSCATPTTPTSKRRTNCAHELPRAKRQRSDASPTPPTFPSISDVADGLPVLHSRPMTPCSTRPWKDVYSERLKIERNWRRGRCSVRILKGHSDGVMCLQFSETLKHPSFPILITGSYDRTARVWNLETGAEMVTLRGHRFAIRALQFDEVKLVTGSMDHTLRVWDWRNGKCVRVLEGHTAGVVCLQFDDDVLASGSVDQTVKVWNFGTGECFTLRGHRDWVNAVQLWDTAPPSRPPSALAASCASARARCIEPGKMLFSASDDGTIRLWDLAERSCIRQFTGHMGQVQSMRLVYSDEETLPEDHPGADLIRARSGSIGHTRATEDGTDGADGADGRWQARRRRRVPMLVSGSLDNTVKMWDVETGRATRTLFGHIEGVWAVASNKMRLVSGSHDRTIKVWNTEDGKCNATLVGHTGAVTCLALGEDKIVSGSDDGDVRVWSFASC